MVLPITQKYYLPSAKWSAQTTGLSWRNPAVRPLHITQFAERRGSLRRARPSRERRASRPSRRRTRPSSRSRPRRRNYGFAIGRLLAHEKLDARKRHNAHSATLRSKHLRRCDAEMHLRSCRHEENRVLVLPPFLKKDISAAHHLFWRGIRPGIVFLPER